MDEKYGPMPGPRYEAAITSDAFPDPEDAFAVWDNKSDDYYIDGDGTVRTFPTSKEAEAFAAELENALREKPVARPGIRMKL